MDDESGECRALARVRTKAKVELVPAIVEFARLVLETYPVLAKDQAKLYRLRLAVSEACTNVAKHAYPAVQGDMELCIFEAGRTVRLEISDWGKSFDPCETPQPDLDNHKGCGLGLFIINQCTDGVNYLKCGDRNTISLTVELDF